MQVGQYINAANAIHTTTALYKEGDDCFHTVSLGRVRGGVSG